MFSKHHVLVVASVNSTKVVLAHQDTVHLHTFSVHKFNFPRLHTHALFFHLLAVQLYHVSFLCEGFEEHIVFLKFHKLFWNFSDYFHTNYVVRMFAGRDGENMIGEST